MKIFVKFMMLLLAVLYPSITAGAQVAAPAPQRTVTVSGEAEVTAVPDQVVLQMEIVTSGVTFANACKLNDEQLKAVLAATQKAGIAAQDVQADLLSIDPSWQEGRHCSVRCKVIVIVRAMANWRNVLSRIVPANPATSVEQVDFRVADMLRLRAQTRELAVKVARDKAVALAVALGTKAGRVMAITEGGSDDYSASSTAAPFPAGRLRRLETASSWISPLPDSVALPNASAYSNGRSPSERLTPGRIAVSARVNVVFEIE